MKSKFILNKKRAIISKKERSILVKDINLLPNFRSGNSRFKFSIRFSYIFLSLYICLSKVYPIIFKIGLIFKIICFKNKVR